MNKFLTEKKQKNKALIITAAAIFAVCLFAAVSLIISANYNSVFKIPTQEGAVKDLDDCLLSERGGISLTGDWELFYGDWIISDNIEREADCIINIHERWTGKNINDGKLKRTGYASYRLTILNPEPDMDIVVKLGSTIPNRVYINGQLNSYSGEMSKIILPKVDSGRHEIMPYSVTTNTPITIVMEISYNGSGGVWYEPWLYTEAVGADIAGHNFVTVIVYIVCGMILAFVIFSILLCAGIYKKEKNPSLILLIAALALHLFSAPEFKWQFAPFINFNFAILSFLAFPTACFVMMSFLFHILRSKAISLNKPALIAFSGVFATAIILFYALVGTRLQIIAVILGLLPFGYCLYKLSLSTLQKTPHSHSYIGILFMLITMFILSALDQTGILCYNFSPLISLTLLVILGIISLVAYKKIKNSTNEALKAADLEKQNALLEREMATVKQQALQAQIKPHFIFNALSSIQALYEKDKRAGSNSLDMFASHLRQNVDSGIHDTVSFDQEITNIQNYVELENLRLENKLTLLFDIEYTDFEIPALSLQPFIENAIKYAGTQEMDDGYILVESKRVGNEIIIRVLDNGKGFDTAAIRPNAVGLKNCIERLRLILGAETEVQSIIGEGTTITIKIPRKED